MKALKANPIQELRRILRDQYDFHSILKELIQNADDAEAQSFHVGWMDDWPAGIHPLLCSPAIVVLNDGHFTSTHAEAICCIDVGSKGSDLRSIGKFGLGMKSVFNLCEAFFFLSSPNQPAAINGFKGELLNPWSDMNIHMDWGDNVEETCRFLNQRIEAWNHGCKRWFCLVIPLRAELHLDGKAPIVAEIPNIEQFFEPKRLKTMASLMPLLRSLDSIRTWSWQNNGFCPEESFQIPSSNRRKFPPMLPGEINEIRGRVLVARNGAESSFMEFAGRECFLGEPCFSELKKKEQWPTTGSMDPETGQYKDGPEEAAPHCAVVFSAVENGKLGERGFLRIRHAFFLPLSKIISQASCHGKFDFEILLHGYFFLDAGRKEVVVSSDGRQRWLEHEWNENLISRGIYPQLLPALDLFVRTSTLASREIRELTRTIFHTDFFQKNIDAICGEKQWIYRLSENSRDRKRWHVVDSVEYVLTLPVPPNDTPKLPFQVFTALSGLCERISITYEGYPKLSSNEPGQWREQENLFEKILNSIQKETFLDRNGISYLVEFLGKEAPLPKGPTERLVGKIKESIRSFGLEKIRSVEDKFKLLIEVLDPDYRVLLPTAGLGQNAEIIFEQLLGLNSSCLVLPDYLGTDHDPGKLNIEDASIVLKHLTSLDMPPNIKSIFAYRIIGKTKGDLDGKRKKLGDYSLFLCKGYEDEKEILFSWNKLHELWLGQRLFGGGSQFAAPLQNALWGVRFYRLVELADVKPFSVLFELEKAPNLEKRTCFEILIKIPRLCAPEKRKDVFERLQSNTQNFPEDDYLKTMRYLLHGTRENFHDIRTRLLREPQVEYAALLTKLAESAMRELGEQWRWLDKKLSDTLSPQRADELRIRHMDFDMVGTLLEETLEKDGGSWLAELDLSTNEKRDLLKRIQNETLWRRLPLHETVDGRNVDLSDASEMSIFYEEEENLSVPSALGENVVVIKKATDPILRQKYTGLLDPWNIESILKLICDHENPELFCLEILDSLQTVHCRDRKIGYDVLENLKKSKWLPVTENFIAPGEIVHVPRIENEISRLLADPDLEGSFYCVEHVKENARRHEAFPLVVETLFPSMKESLETLGLCLSELEKYHIGELRELKENPSHLKSFLSAFEGAPDELLPATGILRALQFGNCDSINALLPNLMEKIRVERIVKCLEFLTLRHVQAASDEKKAVLKVFNWYLESWVADDSFDLGAVREVKLLNRKGEWCFPEFLSLGSEGIDEKYLLDSKMCRVFRAAVPEPKDKKGKAGGKGSPQIEIELEKYFQELEPYVPHQVIGGFVALLGDSKKIRKLAGEYLEPRTLEGFRHMIQWDTLEDFEGVGANEKIREAMAKQRFRFDFHSDEKTHWVPNLFGEWFPADISDSYRSILIGNPAQCFVQGYRSYIITLRNIDPSLHTRQDLVDIFFESARILLEKVYWRNPDNFQEIWRKLSQSGQLDLEIVQHQILENAFLNFKQLGSANLRALSEIAKQWKNLRRRLVEIEHAPFHGQKIDASPTKSEIEEIRKQLRKAIESDAEIQGETLGAVRRKIGEEFQYTVKSILFELFQNSDDAAVELSEMAGETAASPIYYQAKLVWSERRILWMHWGRRINEFRRGNFSSEMGRDRGYDADLENMLFISSSDKGSREKKVTGKYGLGFKSVFLFTDNPKVVSGDLGFEVIGGFYPRYLEPMEKERLTNLLTDTPERVRDGTLFELGAKEKNSDVTKAVVEPFSRLVPLLLVFSRKIKTCIVMKEGAETPQCIAWHEKPLPGCRNVFSGKAGLGIENEPSTNIAAIRNENSESLLVAVGTAGLKKLPGDIPTFWVTTPTDENLDVGFAVNGSFAVDIGRARLAGETGQNVDSALRLGTGIGNALREMFHASLSDWPRFCEALGMVESTTSIYSFWESAWDMFGKGIANEKREHQIPYALAKRILWGKGCGMAALLDNEKAMPTGLSGDYRRLGFHREVRYLAKGIIDVDTDVFREISTWDVFLKKAKPGSIVSYSSVGSIMRKLFPDDWKREPLELKRIIEWNFEDDSLVFPETAQRFGKILTRSFLDELEKGTSDIRDEGKGLREYLKELLFKAKDGSLQFAKDLLAVDGDDEEETMRALFAPESRVLNPEYQETAIVFFKACRPQMEAQSKILAQWIGQAGDKEKRKHALQYLVKGKLGREVGNVLKKEGLPQWIRDTSDSIHNERPSAFLGEFAGDEQLQLLGILGYSKEDLNVTIKPDPIVNSRATLEKIYKWWKKNHKKEIPAYEKRLYAKGKFPDVGRDGIETRKDRIEWLKLFLYGVLHTVGRSKLETNRNFVERCIEKKWLEPLAHDKPRLGEWVENWMEYIDEQVQNIQFFHWMKQLIGMIVISRHLEDVVDVFLGVDFYNASFPMSKITQPRTNEDLQGGGPDSPPISDILGVGAWFVMRELVRKEIIVNKNAYEHCYVPARRVRTLVEKLGGPSLENLNRGDQSKKIYGFLIDNLGPEKAVFDKSFDIPLQLISENDGLWHEFFYESLPEFNDEEEKE